MDDFRVDLETVGFVGRGLRRPECVLCTAAGTVYCSDGAGGVTALSPDGGRQDYHGRPGSPALMPNGIALNRDGSFLLANLGDAGGLYRLFRDGRLAPVLTEVDGRRVPPANFVLVDARERVWLTVSTRHEPRSRAYRPDVADGFIVLLDSRGARIVADGLGYTNEVQLDAAGRFLYVNETFGRRLSRFRVAPDGSLGAQETVAVFGPGTFPDGLAFDVAGGLWVTSVVSNRVIRVAPDGRQHLVLEDADADHVAWVEAAFQAGSMGRPHLDRVRSRRLGNISSLAFGGPDLRTVYLGCLLGDALASFRSPVAGLPPAHWHIDA